MKGEPESPEKIRDAVLSCGIPAAALRIVEIVKNDRAPIDSLESAIATNPVLTAHLLALINFAPGLPHRLLSLSQAISALGLDTMKILVLGLLAFDTSSQSSANEEEAHVGRQIVRRDLWEHALGVAAVAARIAIEHSELPPLRLFSAGFLHDIGRVLLFRHGPDTFTDMAAWPSEAASTARDSGEIAFALDPLSIGLEWCQRLAISPQLQETLRLHHEPLTLLPAATSDATRQMIAILQAAEAVCAQQGIGKSGEPRVNSAEPWDALGLCEVDWLNPGVAIKSEIAAAREMFGFPRVDDRPVRWVRNAKAAASDAWLGQAKIAANGNRGQVIPFPTAPAPRRAQGEKTVFGKLDLLVIEEHGSLNEMVSLFLMRQGYHVRTVNNGESALDILARERIHLLLLDLMLPKVDGFAVLRQVHKTLFDRFPYIIAVAAGASSKDRQKVLDLGANEYMAKPIHLNRLLERVQAVEQFLY